VRVVDGKLIGICFWAGWPSWVTRSAQAPHAETEDSVPPPGGAVPSANWSGKRERRRRMGQGTGGRRHAPDSDGRYRAVRLDWTPMLPWIPRAEARGPESDAAQDLLDDRSLNTPRAIPAAPFVSGRVPIHAPDSGLHSHQEAHAPGVGVAPWRLLGEKRRVVRRVFKVL
jgi:hypothetical protein